MQDGLTEGVAAVLTKPLNLQQLLSFLDPLCKDNMIVVIDDDAQYCQSMQDILRHHDYDVQTYHAVADIDEHLLDERGIILLLDMKLDGMSGLDVLLLVRSKHPGLPVILITGHAEEMAEDLAQSLEEGAHTCLKKPVNIPEFLGIIKDVRIEASRRFLKDALK